MKRVVEMPRRDEAEVEGSLSKTMEPVTSLREQPEIYQPGLLRWNQRFALSERQTKVSAVHLGRKKNI